MQFNVFITLAALATVLNASVVPVDKDTLVKRETSYGNPDLVVDQGNRWKLNFGSTDGHPNACPGHFICYIPKAGDSHGDESWGNPDDMVDEGDRWRFNYGNANGNPCGDHFICYYNK